MTTISNNTQPICKSLFGKQWESLPKVIRQRYTICAHSNDLIQLKGSMSIYFSRLLSLVMPLFKLAGILVPYQGKDVPVNVNFLGKPDSNAFYIERIFYFPNKKPYYFRSHMITTSNNEAIEFMRFGFGWKMTYCIDGNKVVFQHKSYALKIFDVNITLPISFLIGKVYVEELAISDDSYQMLMKITHPLFGKLFEYSGTFNIISNPV